MKHLSSLIIIFLIINTLCAQSSIDNFSSIHSAGKMPSHFEMLLKEELTNPEDIYLREVILGGRLIYGTPINDYINQILDHILLPFPQLREEVSCYVVRSAEVNAYSTATGTLFINLGLIAQCSNESELAFILAHEVTHYAEKHFYQKRELRNRPKANRKSGMVSYLNYHTFSREIELESDRIAFERYYQKSSYSYSAIDGAFDVLLYSDLPFDEIAFLRSYVETPFYQFPDNYFLPSVAPISSREDQIDTLSTHPNIKKRREQLQQIIAPLNNDNRNFFLQSQELFLEIRELARFECINIYLTEHRFAEAFYNIFFLQQKHPDNLFLDFASASSLYGLYKHRTYSVSNQSSQNFKNFEGEIQQIYHLFAKLSRVETNVLAIRFLWASHKKKPDNQHIYALCRDAVKDLLTKNNISFNDFSDFPMNANSEEMFEEVSINDTAALHIDNKYQRIKQQSSTSSTKIKPQEKFKTVNYMLVDLRQDTEFVALFHEIAKENEDNKVLRLLNDGITTDLSGIFNKSESFFIYNILYGKYIPNNKNKNDDKELVKYTKEQKKINKTVEISVKRLDIKHQSYTAEQMKEYETSDYNHFCKLQLWREEFYLAGKSEMILYQCHEIEKTIDHLGSERAVLFDIYRYPASFVSFGKVMQMIFYPAVCLVTLPFGVASFALPRERVYASIYAVDLRSGKILYHEKMNATGESNSSYVNAFIYDSFYYIKKNQKK